jgi:D-lactate dehydrogenase
MKILVYSARSYDQPELQQASSGKHELIFTTEKLGIETAALSGGCRGVSLFTLDDASAPVLEKLSQLGIEFIALRSVGYDHVDLQKAHDLGIKVANVPDYSPYSVAEHAVAMLLAVNRKLHEGNLLMQLQDFRIDTLKGFDLHGKTIGIIGTGKIGLAFARIMSGFGTNILAYDPSQNIEAIQIGVRYVPFEELLRKSEIISLHCPLTSQTRHLIADTQFKWMKTGCILINTSRGPVINTVDLVAAIESGKVGAACLDVYEHEKGLFFADRRADIIRDDLFIKLRSFRNVLITGHQAFLTNEAVQAIAATTISNLDSWQKGNACINELTSQETLQQKEAAQ